MSNPYCEKHEWPAGMVRPCPDCAELAALQEKLDAAARQVDELKKEIKRLTECECGNKLSAGKCRTCDNDE